MPSHACQDHNAKGESDRGCAHRLATAPTKTRLCNRECCFQIGKGVNKNATSTAARPPPTREHEHEQSHTARSQALLQGSCHFLACSATTPTRSCTSCAPAPHLDLSIHPSIILSLPYLPTTPPTHLISIAITDARPAAQTPVTSSPHLLPPRPYLHSREKGVKIHLSSRLAAASTDTSPQPFLRPTPTSCAVASGRYHHHDYLDPEPDCDPDRKQQG